MRKGKGAQLARSAGSAAQLVAKEGDYAQVKMPSGEVRQIHIECLATIGQVGNLDHANVSSVRQVELAGWESGLRCAVSR